MRKNKPVDHYALIGEKAFTAQVIKLGQWLGWRTFHARPAINQRGKWLTAVQGDGAGFPDLVMAHDKQGRLIFAELKTETGRVSDKQNEWLDDLVAVQDYVDSYCPSAYKAVYVCVWRPSQIDEIEMILRGLI